VRSPVDLDAAKLGRFMAAVSWRRFHGGGFMAAVQH
jgi:hypothetical protein